MGSVAARRALLLGDPALVALVQVLRDECLAVDAAVRVVHGLPRSRSWVIAWIWNATDSAAASGMYSELITQ